ncbi:MAG: hypothetical protein U1E25_15550 [Methylocystis sp.]
MTPSPGLAEGAGRLAEGGLEGAGEGLGIFQTESKATSMIGAVGLKARR